MKVQGNARGEAFFARSDVFCGAGEGYVAALWRTRRSSRCLVALARLDMPAPVPLDVFRGRYDCGTVCRGSLRHPEEEVTRSGMLERMPLTLARSPPFPYHVYRLVRWH